MHAVIISPVEDALNIPSVTGVDLEYKIAGPGGRSYAYVVDWHIRILLTLAWYVLGSLIYSGGIAWVGSDDAGFEGFLFVVILPTVAIYFLYHPILEIAMQGRTPGKRIAGIRIVTQAGDLPGVGAILIRNVLRIVDSLPFVYAVGLLATMFTKQSVRIGDMAAGTLLVYETQTDEGSIAQLQGDAIASLGLDQTELVRELLDRWPELAPETRSELGRKLLVRLGRSAHGGEEEIFTDLRSLLIGDS